LCILYSNAVLVSESHLAKSGVKNVGGAAPPKTPMEKYKLRVAVGRLTGRMDLACKAVWPAEDGSHSQVQSQASLQTATADTLDEGGDAVFLTQDGESVTSAGDQEAKGSEEEGIFEQVADSRDGNAAEEAALAEATATGQGAAKQKPKAKEMMLDFRLSVVPKEILKISGKPRQSAVTLASFTELILPFIVLNAELTELWLCNNVISTIPDGLGDLKQLTTLSFNNNKLDTLSPGLCQLVNLRRLYVRGNNLQALPNLMGQLQHLQYLDCAHNKFTVFPEVLTSMPRLVHMDFSRNAITSLPATLEALQHLVYLSLQSNRVAKPQPVLLRMPWLEVLGVPLSAENRGAVQYGISLSEEHELTSLLKSRAAASLTARLRRKKKKSNYL
jgi:hypothetical protein